MLKNNNLCVFCLDRTAKDIHRETMLLEERVRLVDETMIAMIPPAGSGIPGKFS